MPEKAYLYTKNSAQTSVIGTPKVFPEYISKLFDGFLITLRTRPLLITRCVPVVVDAARLTFLSQA